MQWLMTLTRSISNIILNWLLNYEESSSFSKIEGPSELRARWCSTQKIPSPADLLSDLKQTEYQ